MYGKSATTKPASRVQIWQKGRTYENPSRQFFLTLVPIQMHGIPMGNQVYLKLN